MVLLTTPVELDHAGRDVGAFTLARLRSRNASLTIRRLFSSLNLRRPATPAASTAARPLLSHRNRHMTCHMTWPAAPTVQQLLRHLRRQHALRSSAVPMTVQLPIRPHHLGTTRRGSQIANGPWPTSVRRMDAYRARNGRLPTALFEFPVSARRFPVMPTEIPCSSPARSTPGSAKSQHFRGSSAVGAPIALPNSL